MTNQKRQSKRILSLTYTFLLLMLFCSCKDDARAMWKSVVKKCANNDLIGSDVLFFGPSNKLGPGTIWQKFTEGGGGIQVSHKFSEYAPDPESLINRGQAFSCQGMDYITTKIGAELSLESALSFTPSLGAELKRAKEISVKVNSAQWVDIITGPFREHVLGLSDDDSVKKDLLNNGHLVLSRALKIQGMTAELSFSTEIGGELKAKFPEIGPSDADVGLNGEWTGETKLVITCTSDFYIAGELREFRVTGLAAPSDDIGPKVENVDKLKVIGR